MSMRRMLSKNVLSESENLVKNKNTNDDIINKQLKT